MDNASSFEFELVTVTAINKELSRPNPKKAPMVHSIPPRVLKENKDIFAPLLTKNFNNSISQNEFPNNLELGDIAPLFKRMKLQIRVLTDPLI